MTVRVFADTNIIIYAESQQNAKSASAISIIEQSPVISTQVINETISVLTKKHGFLLLEAHEVASCLLDLCEVVAVDATTVRKAIVVTQNYNVSHWDSLIIAAALLADCQVLLSEDLQHGQIFERQLTIVNPFLHT